MADESPQPIDPQRSLKRSLDQLTQAVRSMNKHLESLDAEGQGQYIEGQKESNAAKKIREASWSMQEARKPSSQLQQPGSLNPDASISDAIASIKSAYENQNVNAVQRAADMVNKAGTMRLPEAEAQEAKEDEANYYQELQDKRMTGLGWMTPDKMEKLRAETPHLKGYSYGNWERKARVVESRVGGAQAYATKAAAKMGEEGHEGLANAFGSVAKGAGKIEENAMPIVIGVDMAKRAWAGMEKGQRNVIEGTGLGYSGEGVPGGQFLPGGIRNPLALFTEAGQQGFGIKAAAIENALKGNLGFGESAKLSENLASLGFSNRHGSGIPGFLGLDNSGRNQELVELGSKAKREGLPEAEFVKMAEGIRFGGGSIKQLNENINGLGEAAKNAGTSTKVLAESMNEYAALTEKEGPKTAQERKGREIFENTGRPAKLTAEVNNTALGKATAGRYGILPGTIGNTKGDFQNAIELQTIEQAAHMTRGGVVAHITNPETGETITSGNSKEMQAAEMSKIYGIPPQLAMLYLNDPKKFKQSEFAGGEISNHIKRLQAEQKSGLPGYNQGAEWGKLWGATDDLITAKQYQADYKIDKGGIKSQQALQAQVDEAKEKLNEQQGNGQGEITLSKEAQRFFKLNMPKQYAKFQKEREKEEGKSGAQGATKPSTGKTSIPGEALGALGNAAQAGAEALPNLALHAFLP
jgi:hypothetical protein